MKLLILGGTGLSGTAITLEALARGHEVVCVHRGHTDTLAQLDDAKLLDYVHDRSDGHAALTMQGPFDAVIDVSARIPAWVADAVRSLDEHAPWWVQVSSVSAYADLSQAGIREDAPVATFEDPAVELQACTDPKVEFDYEWYGPAKAACERLLLERSTRWERSTILRATLISGAHDGSWRFPWWVERIARGGTAVAPPAGDPVQLIDARDLAWLALEAVEQRRAGVFNAGPPAGSQTVGGMLEGVCAAVRAAGIEPARVVHATRELLEAHDVEPWSDLPAWLPDGIGYTGMVTADTSLLRETFGYDARSLEQTAAWVLEWIGSGARSTRTSGLDAEREQRILAAC